MRLLVHVFSMFALLASCVAALEVKGTVPDEAVVCKTAADASVVDLGYLPKRDKE